MYASGDGTVDLSHPEAVKWNSTTQRQIDFWVTAAAEDEEGGAEVVDVNADADVGTGAVAAASHPTGFSFRSHFENHS